MSFLTCYVGPTINKILSDTTKIIQVRYAARKGTRERKEKKKVKVQIEKIGFVPHNLRNKDKFLVNRKERKFNDDWKSDPVDNVYPTKYYKWVVYPFSEAVKAHRETHHPDMYNKPNERLHVSIELNMQGEKKTRFVDNFSRITAIPHPFDHGEERRVLAFSKDENAQKAASEAGAQLAGGPELIKEIQHGHINLHDFQFIVAHPDMLAELVAIRGLLKRKFPSPKIGTLDIDLPGLVTKFMHGISYKATKDEYEKDFGIIETVIGTLDMNEKHLEGNFSALIKDVYTMKPKREGTFISRCLLWSPPSREKLKVDHNLYINEISEKDDEDEAVEVVSL